MRVRPYCNAKFSWLPGTLNSRWYRVHPPPKFVSSAVHRRRATTARCRWTAEASGLVGHPWDRVRPACAPLQRCSRWRLACLSSTACALCSLHDATLPPWPPRTRRRTALAVVCNLSAPAAPSLQTIVTRGVAGGDTCRACSPLVSSFSKLPAPRSLVCLLLLA